MSVKKALAALPLVLNACGGGEGDAPAGNTPQPGHGMWKGAISAGVISTTTSSSGVVNTDDAVFTDSAGIGLYTSDNRAFFYKEDDGTLFANDLPGIFNNNLSFSPDTYRFGSLTGSVIFDGNPYVYTSIQGQYGTSISGNYVLSFNDQYLRGASLSTLTGSWGYMSPAENAIGDWVFAVAANGTFTITSNVVASCSGEGSFTLIGDGSKNEYYLPSVSLVNCGSFTGTYKGIAATTDTNSQNDTIIMSIYNADHGFFLKPVKN